DKELDDMEIIARTVRQWAQKNFDKKDENPEGFRNVILYYKMAVQYGVEHAQQQQSARHGGSATLSTQQSAKRRQTQQSPTADSSPAHLPETQNV
ncbi:MAG TPA: hypothetical protein VJA94_16510, partial [Candidatus Angelobacter sp.]